jgi:hypothetical protein
MAYTINLTDGSIFATIADGTINTSSSMILVGKNYAGYGEFLDENFIHLLENGANNTAPGAPLTGQLWWDKTNNLLKVYNGTTFKVISASTASPSQPTSNVTGDLWFDTTNQQLKVYNGSAWILVGPASTSGQGTSGAIVTTLTDNVSVDHVVIQLFVQNTLVGIISKDATFTPVPSISGFTTISPGIQLSTTVSSALFRGTATDSQLLNTLSSTQFLRSDANDTTSGTLGILNDSGLTVGLDQDAKISVNTATSEVTFQNQTQDANLSFKINDGGVTTTAIFVNGSTSAVSIPSTLSVTGNITGGNLITSGTFQAASISSTGNITGGNLITTGVLSVTGNANVGNISATSIVGTLTTASQTNITSLGALSSLGVAGNATVAGTISVNTNGGVLAILNGGGNGVGNIGSSTSYFNTVFATSTSAQYADVAERFSSDSAYEPGTVVELGGVHEVTISNEDLSENVFGVVSTRAAYLMNSGAGNDATHPPIAMTGRVPVRITGKINKGDRLVSAGNGLARAALPGEATAFNVIGRALESSDSLTSQTVEAIVTIK